MALTSSSPTSDVASLSEARGGVTIALIGREAGRAALHALLLPTLDGKAKLVEAASPPTGADSVLIPIETGLSEVGDDPLAELVEPVGPWLAEHGRRCEVGGAPVFVVLTHVERLAQAGNPMGDVARPESLKDAAAVENTSVEDSKRTAGDLGDRLGDPLGDWLQRIEAAKLDLHRRLRSALPGHVGFGAAQVHVWAVADHRPAFKGTPATGVSFGVAELSTQILAEARRFKARRGRQPARVRAVVLSLTALLAAMILLASWLAADRTEKPLVPLPPDEQPDLTTRLQELASQGRRLLRFEGFQNPAGAIDWPRWFKEVEAFGRQLDAERRPVPTAEKDGKALVAAWAVLEGARPKLQVLMDRVLLFKLAGNLADKPAVLHIPAAFTIHQASERLAELHQHYPNFEVRPLPGEIPLQVAQELEATAHANYEKLLEPARQVVANRLKETSPGGGETPEAWRKLADGWLANRAHAELADWRELAMLLARLARASTEQAGDPPDPIVELQTFLRREHFDLPIGRLEFHLPDLTLGGKKVTGLVAFPQQLVLRYQPPRGPEAKPPHFWGSGKVGDRQVFLGDPTRLSFEPGGRLSAQLRLTDDDGNAWLLTWPAAEARSPVYSFHVLTQAPRLHPASVTDPTRGELAFDVRLILSQPELFELPDLFPR